MPTLDVPSQTWSAGAHDYGPVTLSAGIHNVSIQPSGTPNDFETGTPGRTITAVFQDNLGPGGTFQEIARAILTTGTFAKDGTSMPTVACGTGDGWPGGQIKMTATFSAQVTTGFTITF